MSIASKVRPVKGNHSIKEVVISLFLVDPISKPEKYKTLLQKEYRERFDRCEPVSNFQIQFRREDNHVRTQFDLQQNAGFKFIREKDETTERILQGVNEPKRSFMSYHSLNYTRWFPFLENFKKDINILASYEENAFIRGFSLHYIDEFYWIHQHAPLDKSLILQENNKKIPADFFTAKNPVYSLISEKKMGDSVYFDRLEIKVHQTKEITLTISHNVTENLTDPMKFNTLFDSDFEQKINEMHSYNKELLADILQEEIQLLIGLKKHQK